MQARTAQILLMVAGFLAGVASIVLVIVLVSGRDPVPSAGASAIGGPFTLTDQDGRTVTDQDLRGRPFLVFFGFTHCPDVCPTALFEISEVLGKLGPDAQKVSALFVTIDPERDTPAAMKDYLSSFNPRLTGLTGDAAAIAAVAKEYRVYVKKVPLDGGDYTMDHTALVYLMDKNGKFVAPFNLKRTSEDAAAELRRYL
jgi:protein SCO1/2